MPSPPPCSSAQRRGRPCACPGPGDAPEASEPGRQPTAPLTPHHRGRVHKPPDGHWDLGPMPALPLSLPATTGSPAPGPDSASSVHGRPGRPHPPSSAGPAMFPAQLEGPFAKKPLPYRPHRPLWPAPTPASSGDVTAHGKAGRGGAGGDHPRHRHTTHIHVPLTHAYTHACTYMHTHAGTCIHTHAPHAHTRTHSIRRHTLAHACITVAHVHADTLSPPPRPPARLGSPNPARVPPAPPGTRR